MRVGRNPPLWVIAFTAPFVVYLATICPTIYGLDSPELTTAAHLLGISHPPGHPLHALLGKLTALLPFGDVALRLSLLSALLGALAVVALFAVLARFVRPIAALALAAAFGASHAVWFQSIRAEVYTLHAALAMGAVAAVVCIKSAERARCAAAFLVGIALANHHYLTLVVVPGLVALHFAVSGRIAFDPRRLIRAGAFVALGLAIYLYLPLRAGKAPEIDWGRPDTVSRFGWTVSARLFQKAAETPRASLHEGAVRAFEIVAEDLHLVAVEAGLMALLALLLVRETRRLGIALLVLLLGAIFPKAQMGFLTSNPDDHGYLIVALAPLLVAIAAGLRLANERLIPRLRASLQRGTRVIAAVLIGALPLLVAVENSARNDGRSRRGADAIARDELRSLPTGTLFFSAYFKTEFAFAYLQGVERARPDLTVVRRNALRLPGVILGLSALPAAEKAMVEAYRRGVDNDMDATMRALAERRPFWWEIDFITAERDARHLVPRGFFAEWVAEPTLDDLLGAGRAEAAFFSGREARLLVATGGEREDIETIFWVHYLRGRFWAARGERTFAASAYDRALAIDPNNRDVQSARARVSE